MALISQTHITQISQPQHEVPSIMVSGIMMTCTVIFKSQA